MALETCRYTILSLKWHKEGKHIRRDAGCDFTTTIVAIYTGQGLSDLLQAVFSEYLPDCRLVNIIDDSIIQDVIRHGKVKPSVARRLILYYQIAVDIGADIILNTCSSVGEVVEIARQLIDTPIVRIDEPMADEAVKNYHTIGVLATLPTTLEPTIRLIKSRAACLRKKVSVIEGLAPGAYQALIRGETDQHDNLIFEAASEVAAQAEVIVLAQGSMARMEKALMEKIGKPVLSSPYLAAKAIGSMLGKKTMKIRRSKS